MPGFQAGEILQRCCWCSASCYYLASAHTSWWVRSLPRTSRQFSSHRWHCRSIPCGTIMRMLAALVASLIFTFTYATLAAKSRRFEIFLIPILDVLQSVPILGYLSFTVVFFVSLFRAMCWVQSLPPFSPSLQVKPGTWRSVSMSRSGPFRAISTRRAEACGPRHGCRLAGSTLSWDDFWTAVSNGGLTLLRVVILVVLASAIWVPIGVAVGLRPKLTVLTAETLRTDLLDLWVEHQLPTKAVLMVTHNIEEAVLMCDRILVLGSNPGHIAAEIRVPLPQPRNRLDATFHAIVDQIYSILTSRMAESIGAQSQIHGGLVQHLPLVSINRIGGFIETLASPFYGGHAELAKIAEPLALKINDLFPVAAALHILEFAELQDFHIRQVLDERDDHHAPRERFEFELQDHLSRSDAEKTLLGAISWGRYAELFTYDDRTQIFGLDHAE
jgi:ABC-type proline/glycine betaine transport system permease subunit